MEEIQKKWNIKIKYEFDESKKAKDISEVFAEAFKAFLKSEISIT